MIKCCLVMDSSLGYRKARELLEERFGHPFTIASKYVTKLKEGPMLKPWDLAGLLAFPDRLTDCEHTLESIGYLEEINSADNLRRIVQRLPFQKVLVKSKDAEEDIIPCFTHRLHNKRSKVKTEWLIKKFRLTAVLHYKVDRLTVPQLEEERCA